MKSWIVVISLVFSNLALANESDIKLKNGPGKNLVSANCAMCHSLDYITANSGFLDRAGWQKTVDKMVNIMGAPIGPDDVTPIVDYLTTYYGK